MPSQETTEPPGGESASEGSRDPLEHARDGSDGIYSGGAAESNRQDGLTTSHRGLPGGGQGGGTHHRHALLLRPPPTAPPLPPWYSTAPQLSPAGHHAASQQVHPQPDHSDQMSRLPLPTTPEPQGRQRDLPGDAPLPGPLPGPGTDGSVDREERGAVLLPGEPPAGPGGPAGYDMNSL